MAKATATKRMGHIAGKTLGNSRENSACKSLAGHTLQERKSSSSKRSSKR